MAVSRMLPAKRTAVMYVHADNIARTGLDFAAQLAGFRVPLQLAADIPPVGLSVGTEGSALRMDAAFTNEFIDNVMSAILQLSGPGGPGAGGPPPGGL